jgi:hypothetical protein
MTRILITALAAAAAVQQAVAAPPFPTGTAPAPPFPTGTGAPAPPWPTGGPFENHKRWKRSAPVEVREPTPEPPKEESLAMYLARLLRT